MTNPHARTFTLVVMALTLSSCATNTPDAPTSPGAATAPASATASAPASAIDYLCGSERVRLLPDGSQAELITDSGRYDLEIARSASGARYADGTGTEFWTRRDEAMFTEEGERQPPCVRLERLVGDWSATLDGTTVSISFGDDGRLSAYAGCNRMNGSWRIGEGADVTFGAMASTLMLCPNGQEGAARRIGALFSDRALTLRFEDPDRAALEGTDERVELVREAAAAP